MIYYNSRNIVLSYASKYFRLQQTLHSSKDALLFRYEEPSLVCLRSQENVVKKMIVHFSGHTCCNTCVFCAH